MAPSFVACRICRTVEGKLKNYKDSEFLIKAYEDLSGCPFKEWTYLTKFCPQCACLIRKTYKFRKKCIKSYNFVMEHFGTERKVSKHFIEMTGSYHKTVELSAWETKDVKTIDIVHNPKAYKSKKKWVAEGKIDVKHVTVPKDPTAEIPFRVYPDPEYGFNKPHFEYEDFLAEDNEKIQQREERIKATQEKQASMVLETPATKSQETSVNVLTPINIQSYSRHTLVGDTSASEPYTPMKDPGSPINDLGTPMNDPVTPVNDLGTPMSDPGTPMNDSGTLAHEPELVSPVLCEPDLVGDGDDAEVKIKEEMLKEDNILDIPGRKLEVKMEPDSDFDDMTLHDIKAELLSRTETAIGGGSVGKGEKRKKGRKKEKDSQASKKSLRVQVTDRRRRSNQELDEHFTITRFLTEEEQMQEFLKRRQGEGYLEGKFKCELCLKSFKEQKWIDAHVKKHEAAAGTYSCTICHIRCRTPKLYRTHRDCNHTTRYACRRCPYLTYSKAQALKHHGWHEGVEHTCQHCGATFRKHTTYMGHLRRAHPSAHICGFCARSFVSAYGLNLHVKAVHKDHAEPSRDVDKLGDATRCDACDVTFVTRQMYVRHLLITDKHEDISKDILGCRKCGEQFDSKEELERHTHYKERSQARREAPRRSIPCDQCSEVFSHPNGVYQHYLRAHPDTPYRFAVRRHYLCEQCGKTFKSPGLLQQHALAHLGLRPPAAKKPPARNSCRLCGKTYSKLSGLFRHKLTHMGVRRHKCHICEKAFTDTSNLKQHVQGVHLNIRRIRKR